MLGDLGADVIKIESPDGDTTRYTGPCVNHDMASLFMGVNRNKRSLVLDLKQAAARDVLLRMADKADVFVHNIRPQKLEKIGLGSRRAARAQSAADLRRPARLARGRAVCRPPGLRRHHAGADRHREPDGDADRRAALRADHSRRQDLPA